MKIRSGIQRLLTMGLLFLAPTLAFGASPRDATIAQLRAFENAWPGPEVRVSVVASGGTSLRIGDEMTYRFESEASGYLTAIHVDTYGATTLLFPRVDPEEGRIGRDRPVLLPGPNDEFTLEVQPPVGRDVVYAIVTKTPLQRRDLGLGSLDVVVSIEAQEAPSLIRRLRGLLDARLSSEVRIAHVEQQIDGRGDVQYRSADIVTFFGERTRSIQPAKLDLQIQFGIDSVALDEQARRNVDEFARALDDPKLAGMRFKVAGHTDDLGSESHNLALSRRRADTVRTYLIEQGGIDSSRLEVEAHGEASPLMREDSAYARQLNRRVEFTPAR